MICSDECQKTFSDAPMPASLWSAGHVAAAAGSREVALCR